MGRAGGWLLVTQIGLVMGAAGSLYFAAVGCFNATTLAVDRECVRVTHGLLPWVEHADEIRTADVDLLFVHERIVENDDGPDAHYYDLMIRLKEAMVRPLLHGLYSARRALLIEKGEAGDGAPDQDRGGLGDRRSRPLPPIFII